LKRPKIYHIIDDDSDDQQFLIDALADNDQTVKCFTAPNGQEGIRNLTAGMIPLPDAIFLDLNMPGMNGKQCLLELKRTPSLQHIPVVIYSTSSDKKEMAQVMEMGAFHFLVKAFSLKSLEKELSIILTALNEVESVQLA